MFAQLIQHCCNISQQLFHSNNKRGTDRERAREGEREGKKGKNVKNKVEKKTANLT